MKNNLFCSVILYFISDTLGSPVLGGVGNSEFMVKFIVNFNDFRLSGQNFLKKR